MEVSPGVVQAIKATRLVAKAYFPYATLLLWHATEPDFELQSSESRV